VLHDPDLGITASQPWELEHAQRAARGRLLIHSALYGFRDSTRDVSEILRQGIANNALDILVNNASMEGDPCVGRDKTLSVQWSIYKGQRREIEKREHEQLVLPPP